MTDVRLSTRSEAPRNRPPFDADRMTSWACEPLGITTAPEEFSTSLGTSAEKPCPSAAFPESIVSLFMMEISVPAGNSKTLARGAGGLGGGLLWRTGAGAGRVAAAGACGC
ncbi:MAG: hypothetical protein EHM65_10605, partial [Acidobacteriales bacterium]